MSIIKIDELPPGVKEFRSKPVVIKAMQFTYPPSKELCDWLGNNLKDVVKERHPNALGQAKIVTLEDGKAGSTHQVDHIATEGDWIIQGTKGEFYPCKEDVFIEKYKAV